MGGGGCIAPPFLTSALDEGEWSASRPCRFTPLERLPVSLGRRLDGPQNWSGRYGEAKNLAPGGNRTPAVQLITRSYTDWAISALIFFCIFNNLSIM
jgi:hypothetical protein